MDTDIDRRLATNALRQCDHGITSLVMLVLEKAVTISFSAAHITVTVYIVFNTTFKAWESVNRDPD